MSAARDLALDEHGVSQGGRSVVLIGQAPTGGIFVIGAGFTKLDPRAARHVAALLNEAAAREEAEERIRGEEASR